MAEEEIEDQGNDGSKRTIPTPDQILGSAARLLPSPSELLGDSVK